METLRSRHNIVYIVGLLVFLLALRSCEYMNFESKKSNYTEITGVVVDKYVVRSGRRHRKDYLDVQYVSQGTNQIAKRLDANFWESKGSTVRFYITPEGLFVRKPVITEYTAVSFAVLFAFGIYVLFNRLKEKRWSLPEKKKTPVGTVIDEYDFVWDDSNEKQNTPSQMNIANKTFELYTQDEYRQKHK